MPVAVAMLAAVIERKTPTLTEVAALVVLSAGVMIAVWEGSVTGSVTGVVLCIAALFSSAAMVPPQERCARRLPAESQAVLLLHAPCAGGCADIWRATVGKSIGPFPRTCPVLQLLQVLFDKTAGLDLHLTDTRQLTRVHSQQHLPTVQFLHASTACTCKAAEALEGLLLLNTATMPWPASVRCGCCRRSWDTKHAGPATPGNTTAACGCCRCSLRSWTCFAWPSTLPQSPALSCCRCLLSER